MFGTLPGSPFLSECQAISAICLDLVNGIKPASFQLQCNFGEEEEVAGCQIIGVRLVGDDSLYVFRKKLLGETERFRGEASRSVFTKVRGDVFARFHAVAAKVAVEPGNHSLACGDKLFVLPQLLYKWRHKSGMFWKPFRIVEFSCYNHRIELSEAKLKRRLH
jgi:hypothetical protein